MKKLPVLSPLFVFVLAVALSGCGDKAGGGAQANAGNTSDQAAAKTAAKPAAIPNAWQGTVVETMDSGGYTYVLLDTGEQKLWCATNQTPTAVGDKVTIPKGQLMSDFRSTTLDRVFPEIYFTTAIWKAGMEPQAEMVPHEHAGGAMAEHPGGGRAEHPGSGSAGAAAQTGDDEMGGGVNGGTVSGTQLVLDDQHVAGVQKVAGGYQVGEIYAKGAQLAGKPVKVRGRVVKFTPNIMGTNWMHIQDGSGQGATVDLTVTTSAIVAVGDMVVAEGVLAVDKDFGAGYLYAAIIEKAEVTKE